MITCKFGGSCTTNENNLKNIKQIINNKKRKIIVFSAIGKINNKNNKLTDYLLDFYEEKSISNKNIILNKIKEIFKFLKQKTKTKINVNYFLKKIKNSKEKSYVVSRGEDFTARVMAKFLGLKYVPAEKILMMRGDSFDEEHTKRKLLMMICKYQRFCTGGFYGFDLISNKIVLLERGGGDISGALFAKLSDSKIYENFTDVDGVKMANPAVVRNSKTIRAISYEDMKIICQADGKVLHKDVCTLLGKTGVVTIVKDVSKRCGKHTKIYRRSHPCKFVCCRAQNNQAQFFVMHRNRCLESFFVDISETKQVYNRLYSSIIRE